MESKNKRVFKRHKFWWNFYRPIGELINLVKGYKHQKLFELENGEPFVALSNHQTGLDGLYVASAFKNPVYILTTDSFFSSGFLANMLTHQLGMISKKKGVVDAKSNMEMIRTVKENGSLLIFPEGNRSYAEFQFPFTDGFAKFLKFINKPIVLYNLYGGNGRFPRFARKGRSGRFYGEVKKVIYPDEYKNMSDEQLTTIIQDNLRVYDSDTGEKYKSNSRAEYLERMFFVCPKCGKVEHLFSKGNHLFCSSCGLDVTFNEDLTLSSEEPSFTFKRLLDWYNYQIRYVKDYKIEDEKEIFYDTSAKLYISRPMKTRKLVCKGSVSLYKDRLVFNNSVSFDLKDIEIASPVNGTNFTFKTPDESYLVKGSARFNPLKYVLMLNKLDSKMKLSGSDIYYTLEER